MLGSIYVGVASPTEAAAMGAFVTLTLVVAYRQFSLKLINEAALGTLLITSMSLLIFTSGKATGIFLVTTGVFISMASWVVSLDVSGYVIFAAIMAMYLILGMWMSGLAAIVVTLPLVYPIITSLGFNPIWFGVIIALQNEIGLATPPVGVTFKSGNRGRISWL